MMGVFSLITIYMLDAFTEHAASAVACLTLTRSAIGAGFPLVVSSMCRLSFGKRIMRMADRIQIRNWDWDGETLYWH
jgi:hypothetical protein